MDYRREIDGLRAIAIIPVLLFHAGASWLSGGYLGVDIFFVISGYLITNHLIHDCSRKQFSIIKFYEKRARRLLPALFFMLIVTSLLSVFFLLPSELKLYGQSLIATISFLANVFFAWKTNYFSSSVENYPLLHMWSLSVEEQFYLFFPFLVLFFWRLGSLRFLQILIFLTLLSILLFEFSALIEQRFAFYGGPMRAWEILAGSLCAVIEKRSQTLQHHKFAPIVASACLVGIILCLIYSSDIGFLGRYYIVLCAAGLILFTSSKQYIGHALSISPLVAIGVISYSLYLWHQPILSFIRLSTDGEASTLLLMSGLILSFALAWFSWAYIETPFRASKDLKRTFSRKEIYSYSAIGMTCFIILGSSFYLFSGFPTRYKPEDRNLVQMNTTQIGGYVLRNFSEFEGMNFTNTDKTKIFIIGDSYAQDFTNLLLEAHPNIKESTEISTHKISARCGNLMLREHIKEILPKKERQKCSREQWYQDPAIQYNLPKADIIILASSWLDWVIPHLPQSIQNIQTQTNAKIYILSGKKFGPINPRHLLKIPTEQRFKYQNPLPKTHLENHNALTALELPNFIDQWKLFCPKLTHCQIFTPEGNLISSDGSHLTELGVRFLATRLFQSPIFSDTLLTTSSTEEG